MDICAGEKGCIKGLYKGQRYKSKQNSNKMYLYKQKTNTLSAVECVCARRCVCVCVCRRACSIMLFSVFLSQLDNLYKAKYPNFYRTVINGFRYVLDTISDGPNDKNVTYFLYLLYAASKVQFCNFSN